MKIPQRLPQFNNRNVLFVVAGGKKTADLYQANKGAIELLEEFTISSPQEKESHKHSRTMHGKGKGKAAVAGWGPTFEQRPNLTREKFVKQLVKHVKEAVKKHEITHLYLFAPQHLLKDIKEELSNNLKKLVHRSLRGNLTREHPKELLERINTEQEQKEDALEEAFIPKEAKKILNKKQQ